ncbi:MAG: acyl carrier protein [Planctomycetota bacterium]|nr:acyl carrier protein [Planctomycetota bacterium]
MANEEIRKKVFDIVCKQLEVDASKVSMETKFAEDLGADSLDQAELVMEIEDEFDISIAEDAEGKIKTVGDLATYIDEQLKTK